MAREKAYGRTWWGNAWVEALERIDRDTNRLPRGRGYARAGRVSRIEITGEGLVRAKVQGRLLTPYKVELNLNKFPDKAARSLKELIANNPALAMELSMGRLPQTLLEALEKKGINLLPGSWRDIASSCSCPDWANPCKHLAALYYIMANEIDKDPFILFALRQMDRAELLQESVFSGPDSYEVEGEIKEGGQKPVFVPWDRYSPPPASASPSLPPMESIDVSSLARDGQGQRIFSLLKDNPPFQPGYNFKEKLLHAYGKSSRSLEELDLTENGYSFKNVRFTLIYTPPAKLKKTAPMARVKGEVLERYSFFLSPEKGENLPVDQTGSLVPFRGQEKSRSLHQLQEEKASGRRFKGLLVPAGEVIDLFLTLPLVLPREQSSAGADFLSAAVSACQALIESHSFVPQVEMADERGSFAVTYHPLARVKGLEEVRACLRQLLPPGFVCHSRRREALLPEAGIDEMLKLILTRIVFRFCRDEANFEDDVARAFFLGQYYYADTFEKRQTGMAIANWLTWLNMAPARAVPRIKIGLPRKEGDKFPLVVEVKNTGDPLATPVPLASIFGDDADVEREFSRPAALVRQEVARQLIVGGEYLPVLKDILQHKGKMGARISPGAMARFIVSTREVFDLLGIGVLIPRKLKKLAYPRAALTARSTGGSATSYLNLADMLDFSWKVAVGDQILDPQEFQRLARQAGQIIKYKEEYLLLDPREVKRILEKMSSPRTGISSMEVLRAAISGELAGDPFIADKILAEMVEKLNSPSGDGQVHLPCGLAAELRPYQHRGLSWLYENTLRGLGSCLADDMGLGKTLQVIALFLKLKEEGCLDEPVLVVCPTTLMGNWEREIARFAPALQVMLYHGNNRVLSPKNTDVVITTYGLIRRDKAKFKRRKWGIIVIDEAQNIKNPDAEQTRAVKGLASRVGIALTGTPVENRLTELWSIHDFINSGYLGNRKEFLNYFAVPIEKYRDREKIESLRKITAPFMLRRLKSDREVIRDLPDKIIQNEYCYLTKEQAAIYQRVTEDLLKQVEEREGIERRGLVFKLITALKQICNHPAQYTGGGEAEKRHSGKAVKTMELLRAFAVGKEKALIFTQYKEMGFLLAHLVEEELGEEPLFFHGSLSRTQRDEMVASFQKDGGPGVMIVSLKAGGTGLNLTAAARVIHYDLWWNPAVEDQATDRTYRIGQTKNVTVHRLISIGTFEEKINTMIENKRELAELTVSAGETRISEMSNEELRRLISLET